MTRNAEPDSDGEHEEKWNLSVINTTGAFALLKGLEHFEEFRGDKARMVATMQELNLLASSVH